MHVPHSDVTKKKRQNLKKKTDRCLICKLDESLKLFYCGDYLIISIYGNLKKMFSFTFGTTLTTKSNRSKYVKYS